MRDLLTGLAIVLIVILTAALAAPYFIDWNGQRGFLEARLSRALGQRVTIGGAVDLRLLPTPYLSLGQTVIGNDEGPITLAIHTLDLELAVAPLLHGEFDIIEAKLGEPTLRVTLAPDRTLPTLPAAPAFKADVAFERIEVSDGTLAVADPLSDRTYVFEHLDLSAEAPALAGPFRVTGTGGAGDARTAFRFSTTAAQDGRLKLRFNADETARHPGLDLDGALALKEASHGTLDEAFEGILALTGRTALGAGTPVPWRLSGPVKAGPRGATLSDGELRLGREEAGLTLRAKVQGDLGAAPNLALTLAAKQLDIDRLSGAPVDAQRPTPPRPPTLAALRDAVARAALAIPTTLDLAVDNATWGGDTLSALDAHWSGGGTQRQALKLAGDGPGGSHLALDGTLTPAGFTGAVDLAAGNLPVALAWLARINPTAGRGPDDLPFRSAGIAGRVTTGTAGIEASALVLRLGGSALTGAGRLAFADGSHPAKLALDLHADALDVGALPPLATLRAAAAPYDVALSLDADKVALGGDTPLDAGPVGVTLAKDGDTVTVSRLRASDFGGATIDARGRLDPQGATGSAAIEATRLDAVAALVRRLVPRAATDALAARAPSLAPAKLTVDLAMATGADGALAPRHLTIAGRAGGTDVKATLAPGGDAAGAGVTLDVTLKAPEGGALLRQFGLAALPLGEIGGSEVALHAQGQPGQPLDTTIRAAFGASRLDVTGRFDLLTGAQSGHGNAHLASADLGPLLRSLALASPDVAERLPADLRGGLTSDQAGIAVTALAGTLEGVAAKGDLRWATRTGDAPALTGTLGLDRLPLSSLLALALGPARPAAGGGRFSSERFAGGLVDPPRASLTLKVAGLDLIDGLTATDASLELGVAPGLVRLRHVAGILAGGRVSGDVSLRRSSDGATLEGRLALDKTRVALAGASGVLSGTLDLAGGGSSATALVANLAGSGAAQAGGLRVPRADPAALPAVFAAVEADALAVDEETIARALDERERGPPRPRRPPLRPEPRRRRPAFRAGCRRPAANGSRRQHVRGDPGPTRLKARGARQGDAAGAPTELDRRGAGDRLHAGRADRGAAQRNRRQRPDRRGGDPRAGARERPHRGLRERHPRARLLRPTPALGGPPGAGPPQGRGRRAQGRGGPQGQAGSGAAGAPPQGGGGTRRRRAERAGHRGRHPGAGRRRQGRARKGYPGQGHRGQGSPGQGNPGQDGADAGAARHHAAAGVRRRAAAAIGADTPVGVIRRTWAGARRGTSRSSK